MYFITWILEVRFMSRFTIISHQNLGKFNTDIIDKEEEGRGFYTYDGFK